VIKPVLPLDLVETYVPLAKQRKVSEVARSRRGFLSAYRAAGGDIERMDEAWKRKRDGFIARHRAQGLLNDEPLWLEDGTPTRRHLAVIMWAWSPASRTSLRGAPR